MQDFRLFQDFSFPKSCNQHFGRLQVFASRNPELKILADFKILAFQNPAINILAAFKSSLPEILN